MKKTLILAAAFACAAFTANAALVDSWTAAGGAWTWSGEGQYPGSATIFADGTSSDRGSLTITNGYTSATGGNLQGSYFYAGFMPNSNPQFTLNSGSVLEGVSSIVLEINLAGSFTDSPLLTFGANSDLSPIAAAPVVGPSIDGNSANIYSFSWDVSALTGTDFSISFSFPAHAALDLITVTQVVPEPSTYALILGGLGLAGVVIARRRRA